MQERERLRGAEIRVLKVFACKCSFFICLSWKDGPGGSTIARGDELENHRGHTRLGRHCKALFGGYVTRDPQRWRDRNLPNDMT